MFPAIPIDRFAARLGAQIVHQGSASLIQAIVSDSRQALWIQPTAFIALQTESGDGHRYAQHAAQQGAVALMLQSDHCQPKFLEDLPETCTILVVDDTWAALHRLSAEHRQELAGPVIGITGSNGKTTVKEYLFHLLGDAGIARSPKSFNSQLGVPLSLLAAAKDARATLLEVGVSAEGDMARMAPWVCPDFGIFTHLGDAHARGFSSMEAKAAEKAQLFAHSQWVIAPASEPDICQAITAPLRRWSWNGDGDAELQFTWAEGKLQWNSTDGTIHGSASCPSWDPVQTHNVASALACILFLDWPWDPARLHDVIASGLRMERLPGMDGWTLLNDCYTSDQDALGWALDTLAAEPATPRYAVVACPVGMSNFPEWMDAACASRGIDGWWGIGAELHALPNGFADVEGFRAAAPWEDVGMGGTMVLKGPREARLEALLPFLKMQHHDTVLGIDLEALASNLRHYRSLMSGQRIMAMVKANAYGLGAVTIAQALAKHHVDYFGVAYVDEGKALREAGILTPIMVMNPGEQSMEQMLALRLEPEIFSLEVLDRFGQAYQRYPEAALGRVHIKVDTGMHRLGFAPDQGVAVARHLAQYPGLEVASVMTHLASAEDPSQDDFTRMQGKRFDAFYDAFVGELGYRPLRHAANTPGLLRHPALHYDMIRLGIGLFGDSPIREDRDALQPVVYIQTRISHIQDLPAGEGLSYGHSDAADYDRRIATLPLGYADGFPRALSSGRGYVMIHGQKCLVLGRVCMDMTLVDVTHVPAQRGDAVEVLGAQLTVSDMAECAGTISYEILTGLSERLGRTVWNPNA